MKREGKNIIFAFSLWLMSLMFFGIVVWIFINSSSKIRILLILVVILWKIMEKLYKFLYRRDYGKIQNRIGESDKDNEDKEEK